MDETETPSAIEYLMVYGWMLLVIAIVGGAIFATIQETKEVELTIEVYNRTGARVDDSVIRLAGNSGHTCDSSNIVDEAYVENGSAKFRLQISGSTRHVRFCSPIGIFEPSQSEDPWTASRSTSLSPEPYFIKPEFPTENYLFVVKDVEEVAR